VTVFGLPCWILYEVFAYPTRGPFVGLSGVIGLGASGCLIKVTVGNDVRRLSVEFHVVFYHC
jgi:hypothetical protein